MNRTCTHCGVEKDYKQFRAYYKSNVVRTLSVCHDCQPHVPPPVMGWGTHTPRRAPRRVKPSKEEVLHAANAKRSTNTLRRYRRYPIEQFLALRDNLKDIPVLYEHPYGVALRGVIDSALARLRAQPVAARTGAWYRFITDAERDTLRAAAPTLMGLRTKADLDKFIPM